MLIPSLSFEERDLQPTCSALARLVAFRSFNSESSGQTLNGPRFSAEQPLGIRSCRGRA